MRKVWERERGKGGVCVSEGRQNPESECGTQWVVTKADNYYQKPHKANTKDHTAQKLRGMHLFNPTSG